MAELVLDAKSYALGDKDPAEILELIEQKLAPRPARDAPDATDAAEPTPTPGALGALERNAETERSEVRG
jgi:predicted Zn-dependent peptidase